VVLTILVPLKAALGFLLSVLASIGAVVAVFQWGWLAVAFGVQQTGPVMSMMPTFLVGVVFGLLRWSVKRPSVSTALGRSARTARPASWSPTRRWVPAC